MKSLRIEAVFIICLFAMVSVLFSNPTGPEDDTIETSVEKLKAIFIIRFSEHIQWPDNFFITNPNAPFIIGTIDAPLMTSCLIELTQNIKINEKKVRVIPITNFADIKKCHLLFISELSKEKFNLIKAAIGNLPILTIGDTRDCEKKGLMINLFFSPNQQCIKYAVNCQAAQKTGINLTFKVVSCAYSIIK